MPLPVVPVPVVFVLLFVVLLLSFVSLPTTSSVRSETPSVMSSTTFPTASPASSKIELPSLLVPAVASFRLSSSLMPLLSVPLFVVVPLPFVPLFVVVPLSAVVPFPVVLLPAV